MYKKVLTFILAGGEGSRLYPLTIDRAKPAVPFGGKYRIIDFTLSNCINSGFKRIYVLTQYKSHSLHSHLRRGWSIFNPEIDEFIVPIPAQMRLGKRWYEGTADAIFQNMHLIDDSLIHPDYITILSGDHIYKMDYTRMLEFHINKNADLTIAAIKVNIEEAKSFGIMEVDSDFRIIGFEEKPENPKTIIGDNDYSLASMGIYIFSTPFLKEIIENDANNKNSSHDFGKDIIPSIIDSCKVYCYPFHINRKSTDSNYWRDVGTLKAYFDANMDLAFVEPKFNLYEEHWPIRTYNAQSPPAKFVFANIRERRVGQALDSIICDGVIISGGKVEDSILSPKVRVNSFSYVKNCILFHNVNIGRKARLKNVIVDKNVSIPEEEEIGFNLEKDRKRFHVTKEGIVVIPKGFKFLK